MASCGLAPQCLVPPGYGHVHWSTSKLARPISGHWPLALAVGVPRDLCPAVGRRPIVDGVIPTGVRGPCDPRAWERSVWQSNRQSPPKLDTNGITIAIRVGVWFRSLFVDFTHSLHIHIGICLARRTSACRHMRGSRYTRSNIYMCAFHNHAYLHGMHPRNTLPWTLTAHRWIRSVHLSALKKSLVLGP